MTNGQRAAFYFFSILIFLSQTMAVAVADDFIVHENGNISIGSQTSHGKLDIRNSDSQYPTLIVGTSAPYTAGASTDNIVLMSRSGIGNWYFAVDSSNRFKINQDTNGDRLTINPNGYVGIGSVSPLYQLDVNGTIRGNNISPSDVRWKTNINDIDDALEKVARLHGITYEWADPSRGVGDRIGLIAQEVEDIFPEAVSTDSQGYKSVAYDKLVSPLIEAVKTLKAENERLKQDNEDIKKQLKEV